MTQRASSNIEYDTPDEATAAAAEPPPPPPKASSSFGFKRGFLNTNNSSSTSSSSVHLATTTIATVGPPSTIQKTRASSKGSITADETETAEAPPQQQQPSTEDPQDDECVLCAYPLPLNWDASLYKECCGEQICIGCIIAQKRTLIIGTDVNKPIKGSKEEKDEFMTIILTERTCVCPFCRTEESTNKKETLKRFWERIDEYNDPTAMNELGSIYLEGKYGLSKNLTKAEELFKRSYDLGNPTAAQRLFELYNHHIPDADKVLMMKYLEEGARRGSAHSNYNLARFACLDSNRGEEKRRLMMVARCGHDEAMGNLMVCYRQGLLSKEDLATTLRAHKAANDQGRSEPREYAMRYWDLHKEMVATGKITWAYSTGNLE